MAATNGQVQSDALEQFLSYLLKANGQATDLVVELGKGYQQALQGTMRLSFANLKALNAFIAPNL
jgi:hypothetical protein